MSNQTAEAAETKTTRANTPLSREKCKFCRDWVNLDEEGNTYRDGTAAHEACADSEEYRTANEGDLD